MLRVAAILRCSTVRLCPSSVLDLDALEAFAAPKSVRRRYAGRRLRARITVTARDASGNVKRRSVTGRIKLAKIKKKRRR